MDTVRSLDLILTQELKEAAFRSLLVTTGVMMLAWYILANLFEWMGDIVYVTLVALTIGLASAVSYWLIHRSFAIARVVWLAGLCAAIVLALHFFGRHELVYFFSLIPLIAAAITFRWQWGAVAEVGVIGLLVVLTGPFRITSSSPNESLMVALLGGVALTVGQAFARSLLSVASWSLVNYRSTREELDQLRDQRVRFLQVQEDFIQANKELARMADRLAAMTQVAEEARRIKEEFVARVSHELRTPLNMVIGFSEVIMKSPQLYGDSIPAPLLADVDAILRNSQHLSRLVDDILDLSQVEAGRMALTKEWISLPEVVQEAVSVVKGLFDSKGLYLRQEIAGDLPPVFCDSTRIRQVVINLLSNAARFTEQGGVSIRARIDRDAQSGTLVLSVADTGPGIAPADQKRIFEPFQQVNSVLRRHKGGTGLGLTISKQFVEMHGGKMWLESEVGVGTTFFFSLPVKITSPELEETAQRWFNPYTTYEPRTHLANLPAPQVNPRYVLVENEDNFQHLFTRYADNVEVVGVKRVEEAISEARRSPAKALLLNQPVDPQDPDLQAQLNGLPFGTPVISCWLPGREEAARRLGVVDYLVKPVTRQDVLSVLAKTSAARKVLLVDDEPEILRLFVRMLSSLEQPLTILQAMNGHRALQLLRSRKPDIMLLDLVMPEMDGFQVLREKSQDPAIRDIPVVVISSLNPHGESNVSRAFSVTRGNGLSAHELLSCIQAITNILVPEERPAGPKPAETPGEIPAS